MEMPYCSSPLVTVICNTYNHERYIRETLDGFIMQKTEFPFEVIVHDDASTDKTADIVREYESKYPAIIKPIYQTVNQYSLHVHTGLRYTVPKARGKYIALCEGDDYWTDAAKLQRQFDYMETHPSCPLVAHRSIRISEDGKYLRDYSTYSGNMTATEVILNQGAFHTASMFFRKEFYARNLQILEQLPSFDYVYKVLLATDMPGPVYVLPDIMSAYRVAAKGSWTQRLSESAEAGIQHFETSIEALKRINQYRQYKFDSAIAKNIDRRVYEIAMVRRDRKVLTDKRYKEVFRDLPFKRKTSVILKVVAPNISSYCKRQYRLLKKFFSRVKERYS